MTFAFVLSVLLALAAAGPAHAATWTIGPGPDGPFTWTGTSGTATFPGSELRCARSTLTGSAVRGTGQVSGQLRITGSSWSDCTGPLGITFTLTHIGTWTFTAAGHNAGRSPGTITNVNLRFSGALCSITLTGSLGSTYVNPTSPGGNGSLLLSSTGPTLTVSGVSGCFGLIRNGDRFPVSATYTITPSFSMTSP